jgi:hypothetical protein
MPFLFKLAKRLSVIYGKQRHPSFLTVLLPVHAPITIVARCALLPLGVLVSAPVTSMAQGTDTVAQSIDTTLVLDVEAAGIDTVSASHSRQMLPYARRGRVVTWSASAGSITADGLFTAPASPGVYTTCAQSYAGTISCNDVIVTPAPSARPATPAPLPPARPPPPAMNAADSILARLPRAVVAVTVPVEPRQDSRVLVRVLLDPLGNLTGSPASERAAGLHVERGTTFYSSTMSAQLVATGAEVTPSTPTVVGVPSRGSTQWTWVLQPRKPGRQKLWITLGVVGPSLAGAQLRVYALERDYTIRRNWWATVGGFIPQDLLRIGGALIAAAGLVWAWLKKVKPAAALVWARLKKVKPARAPRRRPSGSATSR